MNFWLVIAAFFALAVVAAIVGRIQEKKRTARLKQVAEELGQSFSAAGDANLESRHAGFDLFSRGRSRRLKNLIHGESSSVEVAIFDYKYRTGSGKNSSNHRQTVISFRSPHLQLPNFKLAPEHFFHKIGELLGFTDIDVASDPAFSREYRLHGADEAAVREAFHDGVLEFFKGQSGVCAEGSGNRLIYYRARKRVKPGEVRTFMEEGFKLFGLLKSG